MRSRSESQRVSVIRPELTYLDSQVLFPLCHRYHLPHRYLLLSQSFGPDNSLTRKTSLAELLGCPGVTVLPPNKDPSVF